MSTEASFRLHGDASHAQMWRWWRAGLHARQANPRAQTRYSSDDEGTTSRRRTSRVANASLSRPHKRCARHPMVGKGAVVGPPRLGHRRSLYSCAALLLLLQMPRSARSYEGRIGFSFMKAASTTRQSCEGPIGGTTEGRVWKVCAVTEATWPEENDRPRFPRVRMVRPNLGSRVSIPCCVRGRGGGRLTALRFWRTPRSPLTLTERAAGESEGIPTLTLP